MKKAALTACVLSTSLGLALVLGSYGCSSSGDGGGSSGFACTTPPSAVTDPNCALLYEPTYDNVFQRTLQPTCAKSGVSCHASTGKQGGLAFEDADEAYRLLVETTGDVRPGDPACSELVARITSTVGSYRMPPGLSMSAAEQCSIVRWVANGAKR